MRSTQFVATVGPNPGYGHDNERPADRVRFVWQEEAARHHAADGLFVEGFVTTGHTVYPAADGCPPGGEVTADVVGVRDPATHPNDRRWRAAVRAVAAAVGRRFGQDEVFVTFSPVEFTRIKCRAEGDGDDA
jgi:hypothetical protein